MIKNGTFILHYTDDEGTQDLAVEIPAGEKTFVAFGVQDKGGKREYKATWGFRCGFAYSSGDAKTV
jgi:hypothetical protein